MMTGDRLMLGLIVAYVILAAVFAYERNWPKVWYWLAAGKRELNWFVRVEEIT